MESFGLHNIDYYQGLPIVSFGKVFAFGTISGNIDLKIS